MNDFEFAVQARFDRDFVWREGGSVRFLLAKVCASNVAQGEEIERPPLNIALVVDVSGSMNGEKLVAAKEAALGLVERLSEADRVTLVSFASDVQIHLDAVGVDQDNMVRIQSEIRALRTRGMTNLSGGWFAGVECAAKVTELNTQLAPRIIILSDGKANEGICDPEELREHAAQLRLRGVFTSALGIGDGYDENLLRAIAESGGGRLHDAEHTTEISSVLLGELDDIFNTLVESTEVTLRAPEGVDVEVFGRKAAESNEGATIVAIGSVQGGVDRTVVFKVTCPAIMCGQSMDFVVSVTGRRADDGRKLEAVRSFASLKAVEEAANESQPLREEVASTVAQTWVSHVVASAAALNHKRTFEEAERYVARELRHFRRYAEKLPKGPKLIRDLEILARSVGKQLSSRLQKEMVFQSSLSVGNRIDRRSSFKPEWSERLERGE